MRDKNLAIEVVQSLVEVTDPAALSQRIKSIDARGSTNLFGGWEEGVKQLAPFTRKDRIARVILLSDGQANQGLVNEPEIFAQVAKAAGAGITTSTVGLGHGFNESLMTGMATAGEGVANFGQTADDLDEAFEEQFAIISNSFLRQVKVSVQGGSDVQVRLVGEILENGATRSRKLGTLPWDASLVAVVELKVGALAKADALAAVNFEAVTKEGETVKFGPALIALPEVDLAAFSVLPVDADVAALIDEAIVAEKIEAIEVLTRTHKFAEAKLAFEELLKRPGLSDWAKQKIEYLKQLLDEVRQAQLDAPARERLKEVLEWTEPALVLLAVALACKRPDEWGLAVEAVARIGDAARQRLDLAVGLHVLFNDLTQSRRLALLHHDGRVALERVDHRRVLLGVDHGQGDDLHAAAGGVRRSPCSQSPSESARMLMPPSPVRWRNSISMPAPAMHQAISAPSQIIKAGQ
mgnify:CR=1 FL=1